MEYNDNLGHVEHEHGRFLPIGQTYLYFNYNWVLSNQTNPLQSMAKEYKHVLSRKWWLAKRFHCRLRSADRLYGRSKVGGHWLLTGWCRSTKLTDLTFEKRNLRKIWRFLWTEKTGKFFSLVFSFNLKKFWKIPKNRPKVPTIPSTKRQTVPLDWWPIRRRMLTFCQS